MADPVRKFEKETGRFKPKKTKKELSKEFDTMVTDLTRVLEAKAAEKALAHNEAEKVKRHMTNVLKNIAGKVFRGIEVSLASDAALNSVKDDLPVNVGIRKMIITTIRSHLIEDIDAAIEQCDDAAEEIKPKIEYAKGLGETYTEYYNALRALGTILYHSKKALNEFRSRIEKTYIPQLERGWTGGGVRQQRAEGLKLFIASLVATMMTQFSELAKYLPDAKSAVDEYSSSAQKRVANM